ncbi:MAG TPA: hypothetical protein VFM02_01335 [Candidatus Paceibacterota bacterium]|nr:hypothetical protein [Candidatus Paceibacterota bacterium]
MLVNDNHAKAPAGFGYLVWNYPPEHPQFWEDRNITQLLEKEDLDCADEYQLSVLVARQAVRDAITALQERGIENVRTGLPWAEWVAPGGRAFIAWSIRQYHAAGFKILPCLMFTPPHLGLVPVINSPPKDPMDFAVFVNEVCHELGDCFDFLELWNEWNLDTDWDPKLDPTLARFSEMIMLGTMVGKHHGKEIVLGGMSNIREPSLHLLRQLVAWGAMRFIDVGGLHNLRGTRSDFTPPPSLREQVKIVQEIMQGQPDAFVSGMLMQRLAHRVKSAPDYLRDILEVGLSNIRKNFPEGPRRVWVTEYGFPTFDPMGQIPQEHLERVQVALMAHALEELESGEIERVYWYALMNIRDDVPSVRSITTGEEDPRQSKYGDTEYSGRLKLLGQLMTEGGVQAVLSFAKRENLSELVAAASVEGARSQK